MHDDKIINDLFDAARSEPAVRSFKSVKKFVKLASAGSSTSLLVQWLNQNKMNMLISTSGILITATILLFPSQKGTETNVITETVQLPVDKVELVELPETKNELVDKAKQEPENDFQMTSEEKMEQEEAMEMETNVVNDSAEATVLVVRKHQQDSAIPAEKSIKKEKKESILKEHLIVLESSKGKSSVAEFSEYLNTNLTQLKHEFTSSSTKEEIRKFTLKLENGYEADFRMLVAGFEKLELHWDADADGKIINMWYRLDSKEIKKLNFSKNSKFSVRVKYKHQEF